MPLRTGLLELACWNRNGPDGALAFSSLTPEQKCGRVEPMRTTQHMNVLRSIATGEAVSGGLGAAVSDLVSERQSVPPAGREQALVKAEALDAMSRKCIAPALHLRGTSSSMRKMRMKGHLLMQEQGEKLALANDAPPPFEKIARLLRSQKSRASSATFTDDTFQDDSPKPPCLEEGQEPFNFSTSALETEDEQQVDETPRPPLLEEGMDISDDKMREKRALSNPAVLAPLENVKARLKEKDVEKEVAEASAEVPVANAKATLRELRAKMRARLLASQQEKVEQHKDATLAEGQGESKDAEATNPVPPEKQSSKHSAGFAEDTKGPPSSPRLRSKTARPKTRSNVDSMSVCSGFSGAEESVLHFAGGRAQGREGAAQAGRRRSSFSKPRTTAGDSFAGILKNPRRTRVSRIGPGNTESGKMPELKVVTKTKPQVLPFRMISWSSQKRGTRNAATNLAQQEAGQSWETDGPPDHWFFIDLGAELDICGFQINGTGTQLDPKNLTVMRAGFSVDRIVEEHDQLMKQNFRRDPTPVDLDKLLKVPWLVVKRSTLKTGPEGRHSTTHKFTIPRIRARYLRFIFHEAWSTHGNMRLLSPLPVFGWPDSGHSQALLHRQPSLSTLFSEILNLDDEERETRSLARRYGIAVSDAENIRKEFDRFDSGHKGRLDFVDFTRVFQTLTQSHSGSRGKPQEVSEGRLRSLWQNVDTDGSGVLEFDEFLLWFHQNFHFSPDNCIPSFHSAKQANTAVEHFYASMGVNRLQHFLESLQHENAEEPDEPEDKRPAVQPPKSAQSQENVPEDGEDGESYSTWEADRDPQTEEVRTKIRHAVQHRAKESRIQRM
eukprot:TRINITY_DN8561_c0_g1_i3.p1 TRINITY_DN8561_c0_g1~~TRINITY_DN8561_c0_g1_i3.p1  ORF type:complete len:863 (+),score=147.30 TRINITY_DN8561_c0_g1_i3:77-2590(+)